MGVFFGGRGFRHQREKEGRGEISERERGKGNERKQNEMKRYSLWRRRIQRRKKTRRENGEKKEKIREGLEREVVVLIMKKYLVISKTISR